MSLDDYLQAMLPAIETELQSIIADIGKNDSDSQRYQLLRHMLAYHLGWEGSGAGREAQGKRIRPVLLLLCTSAAGGDWNCALPAGAAVELLHNFSLIHDDIQDQSRLRRNRETVWVKWGIAQAINAGDLMFTLAQVALLKLDETISLQNTLRASKIFQDTCVSLTQGQFLDMSYETRSDLTLDDYWQMISGKTAALLSACAQIGGLVGGADETSIRVYRNFGESLGLAFQVQDDWLGIWGDSAITGKSTDSDLLAGKKTLPVLFGLQKNGDFAARWKKGQIREEEIPALSDLLVREGAQEYTQKCVDQLTHQAIAAIEEVAPPENPAAIALITLARKLIGRRV